MMDMATNTSTQEAPARMDPQEPNNIVAQQIVINIESRSRAAEEYSSQTIFRFPNNGLNGIDDRIQIQIQSPQLASIGPCHRGRTHLEPFQPYKEEFLNRFLDRTASQDRQFYVQEFNELTEDTKGRYSNIVLPADDAALVEMMLLDGCFIVELFREYEERRDVTWPWDIRNNIQTLIGDLLKLENQLPFSVLQKLFDLNNVNGQGALTSTNLPTLALRFLNQAFCSSSSDVVNSQIQHPKHLLDLFRSTLLPSTETYPEPSQHHPLLQSIQSVANLRSAGIFFRQKRTAKSLLEIDFKEFFHFPPYSLKIPPVAIDDFTITILVNCVAFEQCFQVKSQYLSAYVCFMYCLMQKSEDVEILRSSEIITRVLQDESCFRDMLKCVGKTTYYRAVRGCYLWKQFGEIHDYYNGYWASIRRINLFRNEHIALYITIVATVVGILAWRLPSNPASPSTSSPVPHK